MSQINWNRQLGLAVGLCALGTLAYWLEFKHRPEKETQEEQAKKVFQVKDSAVQSILIVDGSKKYAFNCNDLSEKLCKPGDASKWEVSEPMKMKADDSNVNAFLSTISGLTSTESIDLKDETAQKRESLLKEYGLDAGSLKNPKAAKQIHVTTSTGKTVLYLGSLHPIGESIFAIEERNGKLDENHVYLIPSTFKSSFDHDLGYWRNKKLLTLEAHQVESFKLDGIQSHLSGERKDGKWILHVNQEELTGDTENIENMLTAAVYLSAKSFASDNKSDAKAKAALKGLLPSLSLTLQKEKGTSKEIPAPVTLQFYSSKKTGDKSPAKVYATASNLDPLFELDGSSVGRVDKNVKDLRLVKLITSMERFGAKHVEFSGSPMQNKPLVLVQADGKWVDQESKKPVAQDKIQDTLDRISGNRIKDFLVGKAIPDGEKEGLQVTLGEDKSASQRKLVFWKKDGKLYARDLQSKRNEAFLVDPTVLSSLPWERTYFVFKEKPAPENPGAQKSDSSKDSGAPPINPDGKI